jgi:hypothetical protein
MDFTKYTIEELVELRNKIENYIHFYEDGYVYICKVRSYGRNWTERSIKNKHSLQGLIYQYDGEDGIVDVYSTNPDLGGMYNYGELKYIESVEDYEKWYNYEYLKNTIVSLESELDKWDKRDDLPFNTRPSFEPYYGREDLANFKKNLDEYDMSFIPPRNYVVTENE